MSEQLTTQAQPAQALSAKPESVLQHKCACGTHTIGGGSCDKCREAGQGLQRSAINSSPLPTAPPIVHDVLNSPGRALDSITRAYMEARFSDLGRVSAHRSSAPQFARTDGIAVGPTNDQFEQEADDVAASVARASYPTARSSSRRYYDFSRVRVHADSSAAESARAVGARAYTVGEDLVFGAGEYAPHTETGRSLLAHELTHVVQQRQHLQRKVLQRSAGGFIYNALRAIGGFFGYDKEYDDETLQAYVDDLEGTGKPQDDWDSDNKAVAVVNKWIAGGDSKKVTIGEKTYDLSAEMKAILVRELLTPYVGSDDERSAYELLRRSDLGDTATIIALVGQEKLKEYTLTAEFLKEWPARSAVASTEKAVPTVEAEGQAQTPGCGDFVIFTELDLPFPVPNNYLRESDQKTGKDWDKELKAAKKDKCEATGQFADVELKWDLGNPKLGSFWGMDINKNNIKFDINPHIIFERKPCCNDFRGAATWSFNVEVSRKRKGVTETGKTAAPLTGNMKTEAGKGRKCCTVKRDLDVAMYTGNDDKDDQITNKFIGKVQIDGANFSG
jgi:uncharacterized protein DUF4157